MRLLVAIVLAACTAPRSPTDAIRERWHAAIGAGALGASPIVLEGTLRYGDVEADYLQVSTQGHGWERVTLPGPLLYEQAEDWVRTPAGAMSVVGGGPVRWAHRGPHRWDRSRVSFLRHDRGGWWVRVVPVDGPVRVECYGDDGLLREEVIDPDGAGIRFTWDRWRTVGEATVPVRWTIHHRAFPPVSVEIDEVSTSAPPPPPRPVHAPAAQPGPLGDPLVLAAATAVAASHAIDPDPTALVHRLTQDLREAGLDLDPTSVAVATHSPTDPVPPSPDSDVDPAWWASRAVLWEGLGRGAWRPEAVRRFLARASRVDTPAWYEPEHDRIVFRWRPEFGAPTAEAAHELGHAWRDQRTDLTRFRRGLMATTESQNIARTVAEGDAAVVADAIWAAHYRREADAADLGTYALRDLIDTWTSPTHVFGHVFMASRLGAAGWPGLDAVFAAPPTSTEQILHPDKLGLDLPTEITIADVPGLRVVDDDCLGEMAVTKLLYRLDRDSRAFVAGIGWDGDLLRVFAGPDGSRGLIWRSVWDRAVDADEVAAVLLASGRVRGSVRVAGQVVDWVWGSTPALQERLEAAARSAPLQVVPESADAISTADAEAVLYAAGFSDRVVGDRWIVAHGALDLPANPGWELSAGVPAARMAEAIAPVASRSSMLVSHRRAPEIGDVISLRDHARSFGYATLYAVEVDGVLGLQTSERADELGRHRTVALFAERDGWLVELSGFGPRDEWDVLGPGFRTLVHGLRFR